MPRLNVSAIAFTRKKINRDSSQKKRVYKDPFGIDDASNSARTRRTSNNNASNRSSLTSYGTEKTLKVTIRLCERANQGSVYYKDDENRFTQQNTLKLKAFSEYVVTMEIEPAQEITYVKIGRHRHEQFEIMNNPEEDEKTLFKFIWSSKDIKITNRKHRTIVPCVIKFKPYKELEFPLQVKFYNVKETNHYKGDALSFLDLVCKAGTGKEKNTSLESPIRFN